MLLARKTVYIHFKVGINKLLIFIIFLPAQCNIYIMCIRFPFYIFVYMWYIKYMAINCYKLILLTDMYCICIMYIEFTRLLPHGRLYNAQHCIYYNIMYWQTAQHKHYVVPADLYTYTNRHTGRCITKIWHIFQIVFPRFKLSDFLKPSCV